MNVDQIKAIIADASVLRIPRFDPNAAPVTKISEMEDYLLKVSWHRGEIAQAIDWVLEARHGALNDLNDVVGWEANLPRASDRTKENVLAAKSRINPQAGAVLREADHLLGRLDRQLRRMEKDHDAVSRAFTFITGQA